MPCRSRRRGRFWSGRAQRPCRWRIAARCVFGASLAPVHFSNNPTVSGPKSRHCERSEAIHSATRKKAGLLRCARNDVSADIRITLAARCARALQKTFRPQEGAGNAGRPMRPIAACAMSVVERTRVSQVTPANVRHSPRNGLRLTSCSSRRSAFLSPSPLRSLLLTSLTPASRRQNHTTSPSASAPFVKGASASTASCPASVTIASAPLWDRTGRVIKVICGFGKPEYFCERGWTGVQVICPSGAVGGERLFLSVIPGRAKREPGICEIPGLVLWTIPE